ncbi:MAG: hypothetical protein AAB603_03510 [Patescibacteria group bacterium]
MEQSDNDNESVISNIKFIAKRLGIGFQGLASSDLESLRAFLIDQMHGNKYAAGTIEQLAKKMAHGKKSNKEIEKLIKKVPPYTICQPNTNAETNHFSNRRTVAQHKIPITRPHNHSKWNWTKIFRGPGRNKK